MIANKSRAGWIGASDAAKVAGNWNTPSWAKWWCEKLGVGQNDYCSRAMMAGTYYEHRILDAVDKSIRKDHQVKIPELRLRVNYDGDKSGTIHEVKTHSADKPFRVSRAYWMQAQVEMFAYPTNDLIIDAYGLTDDDYRDFFRDIDAARLTVHPVAFDAAWVREVYLPRLRVLAAALRERRFPDENAG